MRITVGVISDTHGLLRPEALARLRGADHIIHAGDIGAPEILDTLGRIAPVTAVRGNNDRAGWAAAIPDTAVATVGGLHIYVIHNIAELNLDPAAAGFPAVVAGHSHKPRNEQTGGVLYFNPGSAGPRRFKLPIAVGRLLIEDGRIRGEIIDLES